MGFISDKNMIWKQTHNLRYPDLSLTLWAPHSMTQTLWFSAADSFWNMSAEKSAEAALRGRIQHSYYQIYYHIIRLLTGHSNQLLHSKRLLTTGYIHASDPLHILREKQSSSEDKSQLVSACEKHLKKHLPWRVKWCLGADGGFSERGQLKEAVFILMMYSYNTY